LPIIYPSAAKLIIDTTVSKDIRLQLVLSLAETGVMRFHLC